MAVPADDDNTLLISRELELSEDLELAENDASTSNRKTGVFGAANITSTLRRLGKLLFLWWRSLVIVLTPLLLLLLFAIAEDNKASRAAYAILIITVYWITEACSITVTALLPLVLFPCLGVISAGDTAASYMSDTNMLFVGGLIMAVAFEKQQLHRRIALLVLLAVGSKPHWLLFGFMSTTAFLSMWISNTATAAMILPIAHAVLQEIDNKKKAQRQGNEEHNDGEHSHLQDPNSSDDGEIGNATTSVELSTQLDSEDSGASNNVNEEAEGSDTFTDAPNRHSQDDSYNTFEGSSISRTRKQVRFRLPSLSYSDEKQQNDNNLKKLSKGLMLGVAYAANIGGTATLTGTGPNLVLKGDLAKCFPNNTGVVNFGNWFVYGVPQMLLILLFAWVYLSIVYCGSSFFWCRRLCYKQGMFALDSNRAKTVIRKEYRKLGPVRYGEVMVGVFFVILALLWLLREPKFVKGWASLFSSDDNNQSYVSDTTTVMFIVFLLFILPSKLCVSCRNPGKALHQSGSSDRLLDWKTVQRNLPWNVVILLGSGFALATGAQESGLSHWIGDKLHGLRHLSAGLIAFLITIIVTMVTEVMSNVATTTLFLPILAELAISLKVNPLYFMIPATVSASFAFMLPVATPPNTMAFSYHYLKVTDMVLTGLLMNFASIVIVALCLNTYGIRIFGIKSGLPEWANSTSCTA